MTSGKRENGKIFLVDFGLAKKYLSSKQEHIAYREGKGLTGTARYVSVNTHVGVEQSRRDDLETLSYVLVYFLKGKLDWQGLKVSQGQEKYRQIQKMKQELSVEEICKELPQEFAQFIQLTRQLGFEQQPEYARYKEMFLRLLTSLGHTLDYHYDWSGKRIS